MSCVSCQVSEWGCRLLETLLVQDGSATVPEFGKFHDKAQKALASHIQDLRVVQAALALLRQMARVPDRPVVNQNSNMVREATLALVVQGMAIHGTDADVHKWGTRTLYSLWNTRRKYYDTRALMLKAKLPEALKLACRRFPHDKNSADYLEYVCDSGGGGCCCTIS